MMDFVDFIRLNLIAVGFYFYWIIIPVAFYSGYRLQKGNGTPITAVIFVFCCILLFGAILGANKLS